jgi:hypothetical protein
MIDEQAREARQWAHRAVTEGVNLKYVERMRQQLYLCADRIDALLASHQEQARELDGARLLKDCAEAALFKREQRLAEQARRIECAERLLFAAWQESTHPSTANPSFIDKCVREARCALGGSTEEEALAGDTEQGGQA